MPPRRPDRVVVLLVRVVLVVMAGSVSASAALALVRAGDPSSRRLIELVSLTPLGLPLAVVGACLALGLVVRSGKRLAPAAVLVTAVALAVVHASWLAPFYLASPAAGRGGTLVVMSLNVEVGETAELAAAVVKHEVDVLVLLEVSEQRMDELRGEGVTTRLPHIAGTDDGVVSGTVVLSRYRVVGDSPLGPGARSRLVRLRTGPLGVVSVVAIHTRPPYLPDRWRSDHDEVVRSVARLDTGDPVLLAGDFNATPAHVPVRRLEALGFTDAADQVGAGWSPSWPTGGHERRLGMAVPPFAAIDHVMTGPGLAVTRAATLDIASADHRAVVASVALAPR